MDYFAQCDDFILGAIFDALGNDDAAIIARPMLRATCRRFAAIISPNVSRYDPSWILAQTLIVSRKFAMGRPNLVREIISTMRSARARDNVRAHWKYIYDSALIAMSAENFAQICDAYIAPTIGNLISTLMGYFRKDMTYDRAYAWILRGIAKVVQYWSIDSTIQFLRKFLSANSRSFLDNNLANLEQYLMHDFIADSSYLTTLDAMYEKVVINVILCIAIWRKFGPDDSRIQDDRQLLEDIKFAEKMYGLALSHVEGRARDNDPIPFRLRFLSIYPPMVRSRCIRENSAQWNNECDVLFAQSFAHIPEPFLSHAYYPFIVEEIARNKRRTIWTDTVIHHEILAAAYGIPYDRALIPSIDMGYEESWYFLAITIVHQSPRAFEQTLREYGRYIYTLQWHLQIIIRALTAPYDETYMTGAHCATPLQNIAIMKKYIVARKH